MFSLEPEAVTSLLRPSTKGFNMLTAAAVASQLIVAIQAWILWSSAPVDPSPLTLHPNPTSSETVDS